MSNKISKIINRILLIAFKIKQDKLMHFIAGIIICGIVGCIPIVQEFAFLFAIAAGWAKELYDKSQGNPMNGLDIYATSLGGVIQQIFIWIILWS